MSTSDHFTDGWDKPLPTLHEELQSLIDASGHVTKADLETLLKRYPTPKPPQPVEVNRMIIDNGYLLHICDGCNCAASTMDAPYSGCHEAGCGYEPLQDLTEVLARSGYVHAPETP
ncbi:hypothetical protein IV500_04860 [Paeniglutamicibacter antarcticus]|uniref:Uncharacterized protein n=1 Tax=Arthrobacter terrae TaxID=2935737 RepID=A0A931G6Z0_9MICC|nr:hypothetical protein [Arthrobacter terrae]MBG0738749.1 hypothetical protein [Arthrobacter terrae]